MASIELPDVFKDFWDRCSNDESGLNADVEYHPGKRTKLFIPKLSESGFDIGVTCELYGIFPEIDKDVGTSWDIYEEWSDYEVLCRDFFGLIRMLLSEDARLRYIYRRNRLRSIIYEIMTSEGWVISDRRDFFVLPFGVFSEVIVQNSQLPSRFPYAGLKESENIKHIYHWC